MAHKQGCQIPMAFLIPSSSQWTQIHQTMDLIRDRQNCYALPMYCPRKKTCPRSMHIGERTIERAIERAIDSKTV